MFPIHIIDDNASVREACQFLLDSLQKNSLTWQNGQDFLDHADTLQAAIVILDMRMPHLTGQELFQIIQDQNLPLAVIFLTGHGDIATAVGLLKQGAIDFLEKPVSQEKLQNAIALAEQHLQQKNQKDTTKNLFQSLSPKEQMVSRLVFAGLTNKAIAEKMNVAIRTVEVQRASAMHKMQALTLAHFIIKLEHAQDE